MATRVSEQDPSARAQRPILCAVLDLAGLGWADPMPSGHPETTDASGEIAEGAMLSSAAQSALRKRASELYEAGVDWIQLRDRRLEGSTLYCVARIVSEQAAQAPHRRLLVNRRVDVAAATRSGAHLGFDAMAAEDARRLLGRDRLIGASCHSLIEVEAIGSSSAVPSALDYAHLAPIWDPISKPATRPGLGLDALRSAAATGLAILAQGGLDPDRARQAVGAGAAGIAVTGQLAGPAEPIAAARALRAALDDANV